MKEETWSARTFRDEARQQKPPSASVNHPDGLEDYEAFKERENARRFIVSLRSEQSYIFEAFPLRCRSLRPDMLEIFTPADVIRIHGRNLDGITRAIADMRLRELIEFDGESHVEPDSYAPKIHEIEIVEQRDLAV